MFSTDSMPRSQNTALEKAECRFNGVGVNVALDVYPLIVTDGFVLILFAKMPRRSLVEVQIIGHQNVHVIANIFADVLLQGSRSRIFGVEETQFTLPLSDTDYDFFVGRTASAFSVSATANIGFVHFDNSSEFGSVHFGHCCADAVAEIPRDFVGLDSQRTLNLTGGKCLSWLRKATAWRGTTSQGGHRQECVCYRKAKTKFEEGWPREIRAGRKLRAGCPSFLRTSRRYMGKDEEKRTIGRGCQASRGGVVVTWGAG
jgi:hypothetical protein